MRQRFVDFRVGTFYFKANRAVQIRVRPGVFDTEISFQSAGEQKLFISKIGLLD